ncbi:hypothetical protein [Candidatus Berkiella aquae]|uniref:Uncharacterized protein n=1 Tax=Candidatus Berkiella aquae TaxID=295108 RepID=A0A0Q9YJS1_9GAMM|nr:hypothetical protein [Candidatus Berkiella aquae]MCS5711353.1 hypothetical protein [Candidatus Berkiella aquae]
MREFVIGLGSVASAYEVVISLVKAMKGFFYRYNVDDTSRFAPDEVDNYFETKAAEQDHLAANVGLNAAKALTYGYFAYRLVTEPDIMAISAGCIAAADIAKEYYENSKQKKGYC